MHMAISALLLINVTMSSHILARVLCETMGYEHTKYRELLNTELLNTELLRRDF